MPRLRHLFKDTSYPYVQPPYSPYQPSGHRQTHRRTPTLLPPTSSRDHCTTTPLRWAASSCPWDALPRSVRLVCRLVPCHASPVVRCLDHRPGFCVSRHSLDHAVPSLPRRRPSSYVTSTNHVCQGPGKFTSVSCDSLA